MHRDVKPENIMLSGNKDVTLVDFGLAAQAGEELEGDHEGSPVYLPPEVFILSQVLAVQWRATVLWTCSAWASCYLPCFQADFQLIKLALPW